MHALLHRLEVHLILACAFVVAGCAAGLSSPLPPSKFPSPEEVRLQEPLPGQAVVYFIRAPHDSASLRLTLNGKDVALLPPDTHTALALTPGAHTFSTASELLLKSEAGAAPPLVMSVAAGDLRFYYMSGTQGRRMQGLVSIGMDTERGSRSWREATEAEARALISTTSLVLPER
jgi:hypothetical protein